MSVELVKKILEALGRKDGDVADRLNCSTSVRLLIVIGVIVCTSQVIGRPIQCWIPFEMTKSMEQYIEVYCFIQNTYYVPFDRPIKLRNKNPFDRKLPRQNSTSPNEPPGRVAGYYQWVPLILFTQAFLYYAPRLIWLCLSGLSGVNFDGMLKVAVRCLVCDGDKRDYWYGVLADYVQSALKLSRASRRRSSSRCDFLGRYGNHFLIGVFLLTKLLYVVNAVGQIFFLDAILQTRDPFFGINLMKNLINGIEWEQSGFFPRSTMCDVEIREPFSDDLHRYTIQCVLTINVFYERLFVFLWFWTMLTFVISCTSFLFWLMSMFMPGIRRRFIRRLMPELPTTKDDHEAVQLTKFVGTFLRVDGVFLIRSVDDRVGSIVAGKVISCLWQDFLKESRSSAAASNTQSGSSQPRREEERVRNRSGN